jgi:hypothetical protein
MSCQQHRWQYPLGDKMPLTWDITEVVDFVDINDGFESIKTQGLVFATMAIGMYTITDANAGEFYTRIKMLEGVNGHLVVGPENEDGSSRYYFYTPADIQRRIGLRTNANSYTKTKFVNNLYHFGTELYNRNVKVAQSA